MVNYENGKIYKLICNETKQIYIGSTTRKLSTRLAEHIYTYKKWLKDGNSTFVSSFEVLKNGNYSIILLENVPCNNKEELLKKEREYIEKTQCINFELPNRTKKEYKEENKEYLKIKNKEWYVKNKERTSKIQLCECGSNYTYSHYLRHTLTKKHLEFIENFKTNQIKELTV